MNLYLARLAAAVLLSACATPRIPVDLAEAQCASAARNGGSDTSIRIGLGGNVGNAGIGLFTDLPQTPRDPVAAYNSCVLRKSGQAPITAFADRPELKG